MDTPAYLVPGIRNLAYLLPIPDRLYTSVISLMSEKWTDKESWSTDLSPTTIFSPGTDRCTAVPCREVPLGEAGVYPGWWGAGWVPGGVIPGTQPDQSQDPIFSISKARALPTAK